MTWLEEVACLPLPPTPWESWIRAGAQSSPFLALLPGVGAAPGQSRVGGERGRFGVVAEPTRVEVLTEPGVKPHWFEPPTMGVRVVALGYEAGYPLVFLPPPSPPGGQPFGVLFDCEHGWIIDGLRRCYGQFGSPPSLAGPLPDVSRLGPMTIAPQDTDQNHIERIQQALRYISEGEIYQANLARTYQLHGPWSGLDLALALATRNVVAHAAYLRWDNFEIVSNSMETFLTYEPVQGVLSSFPIKGTAERVPNGATPNLQADEKERAEHLMIVDLVRNDLGRVAAPGSVEVEVLMGLEGFHGVYHATSMVNATLSKSRTMADAVRALFPGGSITGAPKRRAMSIIRDLEVASRGFFTGSIFLLTPDGYVSSSILIRTVLVDERGATLTVGGGITIGSDPLRELSEINHKAAVFRDVLSTH